jgi:hypothetical protein
MNLREQRLVLTHELLVALLITGQPSYLCLPPKTLCPRTKLLRTLGGLKNMCDAAHNTSLCYKGSVLHKAGHVAPICDKSFVTTL